LTQAQQGISSVATAATTVPVSSNPLFRPADGGVILVSFDEGETWKRHSHLGPSYRVKRVRTSRKGEVRAEVGYRSRSFKLRLAPDGLAWRTA